MTEGDRTGVVLVKLGAIIIVLDALKSLSALSTYMSGPDQAPLYAIYMGVPTVLVPVAVATILWFFPATILGQMKYTDGEVSSGKASTHSLVWVGITLVGLYAFAFGIVDLVYFEVLRSAERSAYEAIGKNDFNVSAQVVAGRFANIAQIMIGAMLLAGRRSISIFLVKIRKAGVDAS